jgi:hypothetical protein
MLNLKWAWYPSSRIARGLSHAHRLILWTLNTFSRLKHASSVHRMLHKKDSSVACSCSSHLQNYIRRGRSCAPRVAVWMQLIFMKYFGDPRLRQSHFSPEIGNNSIDWAKMSRFYLKTETESSFRNVVFCNINRTVFLDKDRKMNNVQKHNICTKVPWSQTFNLIYSLWDLRRYEV